MPIYLLKHFLMSHSRLISNLQLFRLFESRIFMIFLIFICFKYLIPLAFLALVEITGRALVELEILFSLLFLLKLRFLLKLSLQSPNYLIILSRAFFFYYMLPLVTCFSFFSKLLIKFRMDIGFSTSRRHLAFINSMRAFIMTGSFFDS